MEEIWPQKNTQITTDRWRSQESDVMPVKFRPFEELLYRAAVLLAQIEESVLVSPFLKQTPHFKQGSSFSSHSNNILVTCVRNGEAKVQDNNASAKQMYLSNTALKGTWHHSFTCQIQQKTKCLHMKSGAYTVVHLSPIPTGGSGLLNGIVH